MTDDELNKAMAERVMGYQKVTVVELTRDYWSDNEGGLQSACEDWNPVTNANDALRVVEAMEKKGWYLQMLVDSFYRFVCFYKDGSGDKRAGLKGVFEIPRAICEASAKAEGVWHE